MLKDLSIIITLYNTPKQKISNLNEFKGIKTIIFNQENANKYKDLKKILKFDFKYFSSKKNIGFSKSTNFLISKVKTKYFLFTQPDITIDRKSIIYLLKEIKKNKNAIFIGPNFKSTNSKKYKIIEKKYLDASCMICDTEKVKKINFFDEDYFLYWNDEDLMRRVNDSPYKMFQASKAKAFHESSKSSVESNKIQFIRSKYFKFGELIFDYKFKKLRLLKVIRQLIQSLVGMIFYVFILNKKRLIMNFGYLVGILNFIKFYIKKI